MMGKVESRREVEQIGKIREGRRNMTREQTERG